MQPHCKTSTEILIQNYDIKATNPPRITVNHNTTLHSLLRPPLVVVAVSLAPASVPVPVPVGGDVVLAPLVLPLPLPLPLIEVDAGSVLPPLVLIALEVIVSPPRVVVVLAIKDGLGLAGVSPPESDADEDGEESSVAITPPPTSPGGVWRRTP
tara:strand:+ start:1815 stop:2276 length:462 start_codon:yes stop_codon:yes gene_type:complete